MSREKAENGLDSCCILKVEPTGSAEGLEAGEERQRSRMNCRVLEGRSCHVWRWGRLQRSGLGSQRGIRTLVWNVPCFQILITHPQDFGLAFGYWSLEVVAADINLGVVSV